MPICDIAAVCCYFNLCNHPRLLENYNIFRANLPPKLRLLTVELALSGQPFHTKAEIKLHSCDIMWHKERLLQIGIDHLLSEGYNKIIWMDADAVYDNNNWLYDVSASLNDHAAVQCFENLTARFDDTENTGIGSVAYFKQRSGYSGFAPGGVWAASSELLRHGLYQKCIIGGGDAIFVIGCVPEKIYTRYYNNLMPKTQEIHSQALRDDYNRWIQHTRDIVGDSVGYIKHHVTFLPYGKKVNRQYTERHWPLKRFNFDPMGDIRYNTYGVFEWATHKPDMHKAIRQYFQQRSDK